MADSDFPVIRFSPRQQDNGKTPGGGDKANVSWLLTGDELLTRSKHLVSEIDELKANWDETNIEGLPHVLKVDLIEKALANTHQRYIVPMFIVGDNTGQIGFSGDTSLVIKIDSKEKLETVKNNLADTNKNAAQISALTAVQFYVPTIKPKTKESPYKLNPLNFGDDILNKRAVQIIADALNSKDINYNLVHYTTNLPVFKLDDVTSDSLKFIKTLPIKSAEPLEKLTNPFRSLDGLPLKYKDKITPFDESTDYPIIGLLDSGVDKNSLTEHWVTRGNGCQYSDSELNCAHGTYIATLLIHGDNFSDTHDSSIRGCEIIDVPVIPANGTDEITLINNIRTAIKENSSIRVWNLSISLDGEIKSDEFSDFAIALDEIQQTSNVIICKSAGNDPSFYMKQNASHLSIGAESIRSVTVGSLNRNSDPFDYTKKNFPAPYSCVGPAPSSLVKPDLTHFGGDLFASKHNPTDRTDFKEVSDTATSDGFKLIHKVGTSFSTPKVAKNIAELDLLTHNQYSPLALKALAIHSAKYYETPNLDTQQRLNTLGYGKPDNAGIALFGSSYSSTMILEGNLQKGNRIDIMEFPYPDALIKNGRYTGKIKVTLLYDPILIANQGAEYCQSNLEIRFGTYDKKMNATDYMRRFNPLKRDDSFNTLLKSKYGKRKIEINARYANERTLIVYGQKYHPVKKYAFDLAELRDSYLSSLDAERHWFLFLEGHYRLFAEKEALQKQKNLSTPFTLIITIEDPDQSAPVYNSTIQSLDNNNFVHNTVEINNRIHLSNRV
ncbi:S8 family peptidase [Lactiplantibacillus pentosus]|jgi:hypothetical protein|uniref:S8 family peptidase n=1 Tax=Lactiplantibacillus pentosus TaxID=1589 RepID=UPI0021A2A120|nr:S8 family peptidase [Lactiplantibacillus pentosus]MCT3288307.1 subtilase [Lactiplantibacillus pentosus]